MTFEGYTLPRVQGWTRIKPRIFVETPLPSKKVSNRQSLGGLGLIIEVRGVVEGVSKSDLGTKIEEFESFADGVERILDLGLGSPFDALMLDPEFEKDSPLLARYRVRFVQTKVVVEEEVYENFLTYMESDPNNRITLTATKAIFTGLTLDEHDTYLADDKGIDHFLGDFEHLLDLCLSGEIQYGYMATWALGNVLADLDDPSILNELYVGLFVQGDNPYIDAYEIYNGDFNVLGIYPLSWGTTYYLKIIRSVDQYRLEIYSDSARTNLLATLGPLTLQAIVSYRYIYAIQASHIEAMEGITSGFVENLALQEE